MICRTFLYSALLCVTSVALGICPAHADGPTVVQAIVHQAQELRDLPPPGRPLKLRTMITNTKSIALPVSALVVLDGRLLYLPMKGQLDELERAIYSVDVPAPVGEIVYQFVLQRPDLPAVVSMRYTSQRACLPGINLADAYTPLDLTTVEGRRDLILRARGLERDLNHYDTVISLLTELKSHVAE